MGLILTWKKLTTLINLYKLYKHAHVCNYTHTHIYVRACVCVAGVLVLPLVLSSPFIFPHNSFMPTKDELWPSTFHSLRSETSFLMFSLRIKTNKKKL